MECSDVATVQPLKPVVKWVGGKRQLLPQLLPLMPDSVTIQRYFEPFLGGGAMLFANAPTQATVGDLNAELINLYQVVRDYPEALVETVLAYPNEKNFYLEIRAVDRVPEAYANLSPVERAARFLYLNRAGYNGLHRVNSKGQFNVPFGRYKNLNYDPANIRAVSAYLNSADITFAHAAYTDTIANAKAGDFVYFDPPYDPLSKTSSFTSYDSSGFATADQIALRDTCDALHDRGVRFMLSNSHTPLIRDLYADYDLQVVTARRAVNSDRTKRGAVEEVVVRNYG